MEDRLQLKINSLMGEATEIQRRLSECDKAHDDLVNRIIEIRGAVKELNSMKKAEESAEVKKPTEPKA
jgi:prefoldin subunit 5